MFFSQNFSNFYINVNWDLSVPMIMKFIKNFKERIITFKRSRTPSKNCEILTNT